MPGLASEPLGRKRGIRRISYIFNRKRLVKTNLPYVLHRLGHKPNHMHKIKIGGIYITLSNKQVSRLHNQLSKILNIIGHEKPKEKPPLIYLPGSILIGIGSPDNAPGIMNKKDQELYYSILDKDWAILSGTRKSHYKHILTPIGRDGLKKGDIFFATDAATPDFSNLYGYRVLLEDGKHIMWNKDNTVTIENSPYKYYFKVTINSHAKPL